MKVGIISGSGTDAWPGAPEAGRTRVETPHGPVELTRGRLGGAELVHISRHGTGHHHLSNHVPHRAHLRALLDEGVDCLFSLTVCGAVDPKATPGTLVVFDDLYFPSNRLPDGSVCTWYQEPGEPGRGHWIFDRPFSETLRQVLIGGAEAAGLAVLSRGCYGHVDGPRFNSRAEIAALGGAGVTAVSQTAGPEVVLAGEAGLPMALLGFVTDYANGVALEPESVDQLLARVEASTAVFAAAVEGAAGIMTTAEAPGFVHRFGP